MTLANKAVEVVGIDLGHFNVKTSNKQLVRAYCTTEIQGHVTGNEKTIEYNDEKYYIERGDFDMHAEKATKTTLPLFLYALAQATKKSTKEVNVVVCIPIDQGKDAEKMVKRFKKEFKFKVDGQWREIKVRNVVCVPECISGGFALGESVPKFEYILLDLGGLISNVALYQDGELAVSGSIPTGTLKLIERITQAVNSEHGLTKTPTQMYRYLANDHLENSKGKIDLEVYRRRFFKPFVTQVFEILANQYEGTTTPIYVLGGGLEMLTPYIVEHLESDNRFRMYPVNDAIYLNAMGAKVIGEKLKWK